MNLSNEDALRLNVLMQQAVQAVRINESTMMLYALLPDKELSVKLSPNGNDERYLRQVRQLLSGFALGSPEGFPVYLQRWNRMGQIKSEKLEGLLKIGEPEAVLAVVQSPFITEDIARRAWWCMTTSENACHLLEHQLVRESDLANELVNFLIEFLPFEEEPAAMIQTARQVVRAGVMDEAQLASLWQKGKRRAAIRIGFLAADPAAVPTEVLGDDGHKADKLIDALNLRDEGIVEGIKMLYAAAGQKFVQGVLEVIDRLPNQDAAIFLCDMIHDFFAWANPSRLAPQQLEVLDADLERLTTHWHGAEQSDPRWRALLALSLVSQNILNPILSQTDAVGTVMRKRLKPVSDFIQHNLASLVNK